MWGMDVPIYVCAESLQLCPTLCNPKDYSTPSSSVHGDSPGKDTGVGFHVFLQGIFPTQGSNLHLLHRYWQAGFFTTSATWEAHSRMWTCVFKCVTYLLLTCIEDLLLCKISWKIILEPSVHCTGWGTHSFLNLKGQWIWHQTDLQQWIYHQCYLIAIFRHHFWIKFQLYVVIKGSTISS